MPWFSTRMALFSATHGAQPRFAVLPEPLSPAQLQAMRSEPQGVFFGLVERQTQDLGESAAQLLERLREGYRHVPPDTDRKLALRAAVNYAALSSRVEGAVALGALVGDRVHLHGLGRARAFVVDETGHIRELRLTTPLETAVGVNDAVLVCSAALSEMIDVYDLALALYSHDAGRAGNHLLWLARKRSVEGALIVIKPAHQRSALRSLLESR
ncbi:MAG: hypothetical protein RMM31_08645 [Anaerolineae bacterium]|nr:hypothetical protein [Thermoflexales bacterium]MDW8396296.1 hypothetical protein [Anaerolineae bacterium]